MTSDHRVAGSSPAGCMPHPEALMSNPINAMNFACAFLRFRRCSSKARGQLQRYTGSNPVRVASEHNYLILWHLDRIYWLAPRGHGNKAWDHRHQLPPNRIYSEEEAAEVRTGRTKRLYIYGTANYEDVYQIQRYTNFCFSVVWGDKDCIGVFTNRHNDAD